MANPEIIQAAEFLSPDWAYTPVTGKAPKILDWQNCPFTKTAVIHEIENSRWTGIGALCGVPSGGLLFLDHDGASCDPLIEKLTGQSLVDALPHTVAFTSGKPGRYQAVFRISEEFWNDIQTVTKSTGVKGPDGKMEQLEFRWTGCQSVVCGIHPDTQQSYQWINAPVDTPIADAPMWMIEQMLADAPAPKLTPKPPYLGSEEIPLVKCIAPKHRDLIESGEGEGGRDNAGIAVSMDLIGTERYLRRIGQRFDGDARSLFKDFCSRCNPPLTKKDVERIWKSAEKSTNGPCLSEDKIKGCIDAFFKRGQSKATATLQGDRPPLPQLAGQGFAHSKVIQFPGQTTTISIDEMPSQIKSLLDRNLTISKLQVEKIKLRRESGLDPREFDQLWKAALAERDAVEPDSRQLQALLNQSRLSIALGDVLLGNLGTMLNKIAKMQALRPEVYLTALLTTIGSLAQNGTVLMLHKGLDFEVTPNLYGAIVADPSQKKSPVIRTLIRNPLKTLTCEAKDSHRRAFQAWEKGRLEAKNSDEPFNEPEPSREVFYFTNSSGEAILAQVNRVPQRGLLNLSDELAGAFKSKNQYRSGRGSDGEDMLSFYDGIGGATLRVDGIRNDVGVLNYGCFGGIQPKILKKFLGNCEDENGNWARFLFCSQPLSASTLPDDFDDFEISESLTHYYRSIAQFAPTQYRLTRQAFTRFQTEYNRLEQARV